MKIICIEEHISDQSISNASIGLEGNYMCNIGTAVSYSDTEPYIVSGETASNDVRDIENKRIQEMDKHGINMQILSYADATQYIPVENAADIVMNVNNKLANIVTKHPDRFKAFCALPWQDVEASVTELERCIKDLGFVGVLLTGHLGGKFIDDSSYDPILKKLNDLDVPLYIHPNYPLQNVQNSYYTGLDKEIDARLSVYAWGWHNEAGIQVIRLILSGKFDQYHNLKVISGHWGEMVPFFLQRMDNAIPQEVSKLSRTITQTYKDHVFVTPSGMVGNSYINHFNFIYNLLGADRVIYSTDYPYLTLTGARSFLENLPITLGEKEKIAYKNAEILFKF